MSVLLRYRKLGHPVTLRVDVPELEPLARDLHSSALESFADCSPAVPADLTWTRANEQWQILLRGQPWEPGNLSADLLYLQSDSLIDDFVREQLAGIPILHAGAVVSPNGVPLTICGASGSGKTSLVLACLLQGWDWLTDELLCFRKADPLFAEGFRRNFNIKERSFSNFAQTAELQGNREFELRDTRRRIRFLNPDRLQKGNFVESATIRAFIVPVYSNGATRPSIERLSASGLIRHLAPELRAMHSGSIAWLAAVARSSVGYELRYQNPHAAVDCLTTLAKEL